MTTAHNQGAMAMGEQTMAIGKNSLAGGAETTSAGHNSIAFGYKSATSGDNSISLGANSHANAENSIALCGGATYNDDMLVLGDRNLTVDKDGNARIKNTITASKYNNSSPLNVIASGYGVLEIDKNNISFLNPIISNTKGRRLNLAGKNLWPQFYDFTAAIDEKVKIEYDIDGGLSLDINTHTAELTYEIFKEIYYLPIGDCCFSLTVKDYNDSKVYPYFRYQGKNIGIN
jgi:hypothetical protein